MSSRRYCLLIVSLILVLVAVTPAYGAGNTTTLTTMQAEPKSVSSTAGETALAAANCLGCIAGWGLFENGNTIRAVRASNTDEVLTFIHVHWAFINPIPDSCTDMYDGNYVSASLKEQSNTSADQTKDSNYAQGGQHHWSNIGAHKWIDDGVTWTYGYNGAADICKDFGL